MAPRLSDKRFLILLLLSVVSTAAVFPYVMTVQGDVLRSSGVSLIAIFFAQLAQGTLLSAAAIFFGLRCADRAGFRFPVFRASPGERGTAFKGLLPISVVSGIAVAFAIYASDAIFSYFGASLSTHQIYAPIWQTLLAALYGGVTEEVLMRLFLMSFIVWIGLKISGASRASAVTVAVAIVISAVIFGLGHLPITASLTALTPLIIARAIVLNGIGGVVFGLIYYRRGIEAAMIAHFVTDVFLLSILPAVL